MPRATTNTTETTRFELKTLPGEEGEDAGFVELRKLTYGQILERRDMSAKMAIENIGSGKSEDMKVTTELVQMMVTQFEFRNCLVDHNLEDENGNKLNLGDPKVFAKLDPQVGQEISGYIDDMNQWDPDASGKEGQLSEVG